MTQKEFERQVEYAYKMKEPKAIVARTVRLCVSHPDLAVVWFDKQPKAVQD